MDRSWFRRRTRWAILWVVAMLMASFAQTAVANEGQAVSTPDQVAQDTDELLGMPDVAPPKWGEINEAALEDLTTMAEQEGISLEEAIDRYAWHESFSMLVADIREKHPDSFAGAMITPDGNPWIAFESKAPEGVDALVGEFTTVVFGRADRAVDVILDRGFTEAELDDRLIKAHYAAFEQTDLVANAASGYDIETGEITVEIEPLEPADTSAEKAMFVAAVVGANEAALSDVTVRAVDRVDYALEVNIYGGHWQSPSGTSGFSVKSGSTRGLSTAGHVTDGYNTYPVSGPDIVLDFEADHEGPWGDFQWSTSIATEKDDFFSGPYDTYLRDVSGVGTPTLGQRLCVNGKTSGKRCEDVYKLNQCRGSYCRLAAMHSHVTAGGDSGGPWFYSNTAYGIHHGVMKIWWKNRSLFSPVIYIDDALGITIATS